MIRQIHIGQLLLLCFSVYLAHNLVPHDHHSELIAAHAGETCPIDHEEHQRTGDHPAHCHAFNELTFNKVESSGLKENGREIDLPAKVFATIPAPVSWVAMASHCIQLKVPLPEKENGGSVVPRAPPRIS